MKFYRATTKEPLTLDCVLGDKGKRVFPAGTKVSAAEPHRGKWHLNAEHDGETYDGYAGALELEVGALLATVNE
jgi:hypothetical protein